MADLTDIEKAQASAALMASVLASLVPVFLQIHAAIHGTTPVKPKKTPKVKAPTA